MIKAIRLKEDPTVLKAWAPGRDTGLGDFDEAKFEVVELEELPSGWTSYTEKPLATGKEVVGMAETFFNAQDWEVRKNLQILFINTGIKPILESATCNPLTKSDFDLMVKDLEKLANINDQQRQIFLKLAQDYENTHQFAA